MKLKKLLVFAGALLIFGSVNAQADKYPISFNPTNWYNHHADPGIDIYEEDGNLVFEVMTSAPDPWQGASIGFVDFDVDKYPNLRITTIGDEGAFWNLKLASSELSEQYTFLLEALVQPGMSGDTNEFGTFDFQNAVIKALDHGGKTSFDIFVFVIGHGERLVIQELYFYSGDPNSVSFEKATPTMVIGKQNAVSINNADGKLVSIYSVDGALVKSEKISDDKQDISLEKGLYVVKVGQSATKVIVR